MMNYSVLMIESAELGGLADDIYLNGVIRAGRCYLATP